MILELLVFGGIGAGLLKGADMVQKAGNRVARKATKAAGNAVSLVGEFVDQTVAAEGRATLERQTMCSRAPWTPCDHEVTGQDGAMTYSRCKRCKRTSWSIE